MALDMGERRVGVAMSDSTCRVATPHSVVEAHPTELSRTLRRLVEDYEIGRIVIGLPLTMEGTEGPQATRIREAGAQLEEALGVPTVYFDERLSSAQARRSLSETGMTDRKQRGRVDMIAASLVLQSYLDST